jgi:inhibitor of cysteine peptidase
MRRIASILGILGLAAATACSHRLSFDDPSKPIEVRAGSEFVLALTSNQSTGYQWVLVDSAALGPLQFVGKDYSVPRRNRNRNGAGGTERWTFRAPSPGSGVISLAYKRPWESRPPADSARFRVTVK